MMDDMQHSSNLSMDLNSNADEAKLFLWFSHMEKNKRKFMVKELLFPKEQKS